MNFEQFSLWLNNIVHAPWFGALTCFVLGACTVLAVYSIVKELKSQKKSSDTIE